jgi:hypothetical protein
MSRNGHHLEQKSLHVELLGVATELDGNVYEILRHTKADYLSAITAHFLDPIEVMTSGNAMSLFQATHAASMIAL